RLLTDLHRGLSAFPSHARTLEGFLKAGYVASQNGAYVQALYDATVARPGTDDGPAANLRYELARLNAVVAEVFDKGKWAEEQGVIHSVESSSVPPEVREQAIHRMTTKKWDVDAVRGGMPTHADMHDEQNVSGVKTPSAM